MKPHVSVLASGVALLAMCLSCTTSSLPGTALGTFNVTGTLGTNTCGSGLGATNPWTFTALLSEDGTTLYWEASGGTELSTTLSSMTQATFTSTVTSNVDATEAGAGSCDLQDTTVIALILGSATAPTTFSGSISYAFEASSAVSSSNNCTDQLTSSGGTYDTLPCSVTYSVTGTRQ